MKNKRLLIFTAAILLALLCCACGKTEPEETTVLPEETEETPTVSQVPTLVSDGKANYTVILPESSSGEIRKAANALCDKLGDIFGVKFKYSKTKAGLPEDQKLILIGAQSDSESAIPYNKYRVTVEDNGNIVISAWSASALGDVCTKLALRISSSVENGDTLGSVTDALEIEGTDTALLADEVPIFSPSRMPTIFKVQGARGAYELCFNESRAEDHAAYSEILKQNGFSEIQRKESKDAIFSVFYKDQLEITLNFWHKTCELLAIVDKPTQTKPLIYPEQVAPVTVPKIIEPGLEYAGALKGMCYLLQLSDGSFIVFDSGDESNAFVERLYSVMTANLPAGTKPTVLAWFISHQHGDHYGGLVALASSSFASKINCVSVYTNMPIDSYQSAYDRSTYLNRYEKIENAAKKLGADFHIARTGQTYYYRDTEICILGSVDDMFINDFNDLDETSLVISVSTGTKRLLFSGDSGPLYIGQYLLKRYTADTLKSDICQATSHGANNAAFTDYYKLADPDYYLWPADITFYNKHTPNKYIQSDKSAEIIYSYNGTRAIELK